MINYGIPVIEDASVNIKRNFEFRRHKFSSSTVTTRLLTLGVKTDKMGEQTMNIQSRISKTAETDEKRNWNMKEASALMGLERKGISCVPRLLAIFDDGSIDTEFMPGIEGDNANLNLEINFRTMSYIAIAYLNAMSEVYDAGYLNFDQMYHNFKIVLNSKGIPEKVNLFDMTAETVSENDKMVFSPSDYSQHIFIPPEVAQLTHVDVEHIFDAEPALVYTVAKCISIFFSRQLSGKDKKVYDELLQDILKPALSRYPKDRPSFEDFYKKIHDLSIYSIERGQHLESITNVMSPLYTEDERSEFYVSEAYITKQALSRIEDALGKDEIN